jgi:hypothetical protein
MRENIFKENIPVFSVQGNRAVFPFSRKIWWQSSKTFQKVNYVLVLWKYTFGVICANNLQIQRKICFKVNTFFHRSLKKEIKGEVHYTVIHLSVTCLSLFVLSVSQAYYSLRHDISKRWSQMEGVVASHICVVL